MARVKAGACLFVALVVVAAVLGGDSDPLAVKFDPGNATLKVECSPPSSETSPYDDPGGPVTFSDGYWIDYLEGGRRVMWRVPDSPLARSQGHRSIPENPFVAGVWRFRATLYEGEGGALCGALLPITVFLAVKATGGPGLASWDRALVGVWLCRGAAEPPVFRFPEEAAV